MPSRLFTTLALSLVVLTGCTGSGMARKAEAAPDAGTVNAFLEDRFAEIRFIDRKRVRGYSVFIGEEEITWQTRSGGAAQSRPLHHVDRVTVGTKGRSTGAGTMIGLLAGGLVAAVVIGTSGSEGGAGRFELVPVMMGGSAIVAGAVLGTSIGRADEPTSSHKVVYQRTAPW